MTDDSTFVSYDFPASVTAPDRNEEVFASIRFARFDPTSLDIRLYLLGSQEQRIHVASELTHSPWNYLWVFGAGAAMAQRVELLSLSGIGSTGTSDTTEFLTPYANAIQVNIRDEALQSEGRYWMAAQLVPSGILIQPKIVRNHPDGRVEHEVLETGDIVVETTEGRFTAREHHDSFSSTEFGNKVTHTVNRAVIEGTVTVHAGESLYEVHERVRAVLADLCSVLSLCYRVPVAYYEIRYFRTDEGARFIERESVLRRRITPVARPLGADDLVNYRDLRDGGLGQLYKTFVESPHRDAIRRVMGFLAGSYSNDALEESYFLAYTALEATISTVSSEYALSSSQFAKLRKKLEELIREIMTDLGRGAVADDLIVKLPELRRAPTKRRISDVIRRLNVATDDLWQRLGLDAGLSRATISRNLLVHAAQVHEPIELASDRTRLWILTERILLKLLGWPDEKIWRWYDQPLKRVNNFGD